MAWTGFVVDAIDEVVAAVDQLHMIERGACRRDVEQRFGVDSMIDGYVGVYEQLLN